MLEAQLLHLVSRNLAPATPPRQPAPAAPGNPASRAQFEAELQGDTALRRTLSSDLELATQAGSQQQQPRRAK